jgi:DNA-binding PadR family transcriptional regulator
MRSYWLDLSNPAHRILYKFGLSARGKNELEILKNLSHGSANVYELKKRLRYVDVHYSTVLRALRRLEKKKLVRIISQRDVGRREKTYACTLLGDLVVALTRNGLSGAARIVAESSKSFRECVGVHLSFDSDYPLSTTELIILNILNSERGENVMRSDLDVYVRNVELEWIKANIVKPLIHEPSRPDLHGEYYHPLSRPEILRYLKKITHINWISDWVMEIIEKYVEKEREWLQELEDFKREVKLARFFSKAEQTL